jgi:CheY-like chemotaxis protein
MTKILLVEDDKSLREIYGVRLLAEGYDIVTAGDGEEALAMAIKERPQLIVSDVMMPKISGFDMLDILRSTSETKDIKVIMMTALSSEDQRARGEALGADRYLVKSQVGIEDVVRTVHEVLGDAPVSGSGMPQQTPQQPPTQPPTPPAPGRPAPSVTPGQRPEVPAPARVPQPTPMPAPTLPTDPQMQPAAPQPTTQAAAGLPQPTAPFSTNRPAGLGDRIIHPINQSDPSDQDIASRIQQELDQHPESSMNQPTESQAPTQAPIPPPVAMQPQAQPAPLTAEPDQPVAPQPPTSIPEPQQDDSLQPTQTSVPPDSHGIEFEETPRTPTPPQPPVPSAPAGP